MKLIKKLLCKLKFHWEVPTMDSILLLRWIKKLLCKFRHKPDKQNWYMFDDNGHLKFIGSIKRPFCKRCGKQLV